MKIISKKNRISLSQLEKLAQQTFGNLVKAVVDIEKETIAIGGELHSDGEALLLEKGSKQENLWGINLYPELHGSDFIEFDSMINVRPARGNLTRGVDDPEVKKKIVETVKNSIKQ